MKKRNKVINVDDITLLIFLLLAVLLVLMTVTIFKMINKIVLLEKKMKFLMKRMQRKERSNE